MPAAPTTAREGIEAAGGGCLDRGCSDCLAAQALRRGLNRGCGLAIFKQQTSFSVQVDQINFELLQTETPKTIKTDPPLPANGEKPILNLVLFKRGISEVFRASREMPGPAADHLLRPRPAFADGRKPLLRVGMTAGAVLLMAVVAYTTVRPGASGPSGAALGQSAAATVPGMQPWMAKLLNSAQSDQHREESIDAKQASPAP